MKRTLIVAALIFISGCSEESKLTSACKLALQTVVDYPDYVEFEHAEVMSSGIAQPDLERLYIEKSSTGKMLPEVKRYLSSVYESGKLSPNQYWIDLRFSSPEINQGFESNASCRFVKWVGDEFLARIVVAGKSFNADELLLLQMKKGVPNNLTHYLK